MGPFRDINCFLPIWYVDFIFYTSILYCDQNDFVTLNLHNRLNSFKLKFDSLNFAPQLCIIAGLVYWKWFSKRTWHNFSTGSSRPNLTSLPVNPVQIRLGFNRETKNCLPCSTCQSFNIEIVDVEILKKVGNDKHSLSLLLKQ